MNITSKVLHVIKRRRYSTLLDKINLTTELDTKVRYFLIISPGHSGSLWFSKVLNSHPDVLCFHEGMFQKNFPRRYFDLTDEDNLNWISSLKSTSANHYGKAYKAIGDSTTFFPSLLLLEKIRPVFSVFILVRNPVHYVCSQLRSFDEETVLNVNKEIKKKLENATKSIPKIQSVDLKEYNLRLFAYSCWRWLTFVSIPAHTLYRLEDLTTNREKLKKTFKEITGISINGNLDFIKISMEMMNEKINSSLKEEQLNTEKIFKGRWSDDQRFLFNAICGKKMREIYSEESSCLF